MDQARHSKGQQHPFLYRPYSEKWKHLHLYLDAVHFVTRLLVLIHLSVKVRHKITTCDDSLSISFSKSSIRAVISSIVG